MQSISSSKKGGLVVLTGPSGVGKGSLVKELLERNPEIWLSISATTRKPRSGEVDGEHYFFLDKNKFEKLIKIEGFLEWAKFAGNLYGTPKENVLKQVEIGKIVLLEIELQGARQVRKSFPDGLYLFIAPPTFNELERRIRGRATDSEDDIKKRLLRAKEELISQEEFDETVINDQLHTAISEIENIIYNRL